MGGKAVSTAAGTLRRVLWARALRAFADGYATLLLPIYLIALGYGPLHVGIIATTTLLGSGMMTLAVGFQSHRLEYRAWLLLASLLMAATGLSFAAASDFWPMILIAFFGTLNPSSGGVSVFLPLEHAVISQSVKDSDRTAVFARYSLVGSLVAAFGALLAGAPEVLIAKAGMTMKSAVQAMFVLYALLALASAAIYLTLPRRRHTEPQPKPAALKQSKKMVYKLAALFSLDSFAGGLMLDSMLVLWLFEKFQLSTAAAGSFFFWSGILASVSFLLAVRIARRFGLVNTMVFTHIPSSVLLILVPFMPNLWWALALLLVRSFLSQMDVPTRTSYVMAIVPPEERAAAASVTTVPRSFASAIAPVIAGSMISVSSFGWPLVICGALKITYDLMLLYTCRHVRPPEEMARA